MVVNIEMTREELDSSFLSPNCPISLALSRILKQQIYFATTSIYNEDMRVIGDLIAINANGRRFTKCSQKVITLLRSIDKHHVIIEINDNWHVAPFE